MDWSNVLSGLGFGILIFLLLRYVMCWYWRVNEGIILLTEIRDELKKFNKRMGH
jgi:hypothetical protein